MATERVTNGLFTSNLNGWTVTEMETITPGLGPANLGDVAWASTQSGTCRIQTDTDSGIVYDGAVYQSIGTVIPGTTLVLSGQLWRRLTGTMTAIDVLAAIIWCQAVGFENPHPMLCIRTSNWEIATRYVPPAITVVQDVSTQLVFEATSFSYDVSHYFTKSAEYRLWLSAYLATSHLPTNRCQAFYGSVSLMDYGSPGSEAPETPTRSSRVVAELSSSHILKVRP